MEVPDYFLVHDGETILIVGFVEGDHRLHVLARCSDYEHAGHMVDRLNAKASD